MTFIFTSAMFAGYSTGSLMKEHADRQEYISDFYANHAHQVIITSYVCYVVFIYYANHAHQVKTYVIQPAAVIYYANHANK
jgi:hypothetical protein